MLDDVNLEDYSDFKDFAFLWRETDDQGLLKAKRNKSLGCKSSRRPTIVAPEKMKKISDGLKEKFKPSGVNGDVAKTTRDLTPGGPAKRQS